MDYNLRTSVEDSILSWAEKNPGLIAMAAKSSPIAATLLGSVTRKLIRASPDPVWVLHPEEKAEAPPLKMAQ